MLVTKAWRDNLGLVVVVMSRVACLGPSTASLRGGTGAPWGALARTHQCATESRVTLWQSATPVRAVGASPVVLSPLANVFASLSSLMVVPHCETCKSPNGCDTCVLWHVGILTCPVVIPNFFCKKWKTFVISPWSRCRHKFPCASGVRRYLPVSKNWNFELFPVCSLENIRFLGFVWSARVSLC